MHELYEDLTEICEVLADELKKTNDKIDKSNGQITSGDLDYIDKLTHALKSVKTTKAMMESEDYSHEGMSYARGGRGGRRGANQYGSYARRDTMSRYSRERGYSMDDGMIEELHQLMEEAPDEKTRMEFHKFIKKMESM